MTSGAIRNPFDVQTPENLSTDEMLSLFVSENTDYYQIAKAGHTFITGPRGAGKSMIFRFLEPDCQCRHTKKKLSALEYYAVYISVKETNLNLPELVRLQEAKHATIVLNEHLLVTYVVTKIFVSLLDRAPADSLKSKATAKSYESFYADVITRLLSRSGWKEEIPALKKGDDVHSHLKATISLFDDIFAQLNLYMKKLSFSEGITPYDGALFGYADFLVPLVKELLQLPFMPKGPIFLLVDDADNLSESQAMILNSWVSKRSTGFLCIKISAQEGEYKTFVSPNGQRIEAPHDYSEFNISDKYTSRFDNFKNRVREIVAKRLEAYGFDTSPEEFFPCNEKQEKEIDEIGKTIAEKWPEEGRGFRPNDDVLRYARPEYMKRLAGKRKSGSTYSYAGFGQLVHLSSGIVRHFLESASIMYAEAVSKSGGKPVLSIPHTIQNKIANDYSNIFLFSEFSKVEIAEGDPSLEFDKPAKLKNLITALGGMFRKILVSESSEQRVFSVAFTNGPDPEVLEVLSLGVKYGYFHRSTIGNKEGTGRVPLYILTRRLAPTFKLDPNGFAGYKFVQNEAVKQAMYKPNTLINKVQQRGFDPVMGDQRSLFDHD